MSADDGVGDMDPPTYAAASSSGGKKRKHQGEAADGKRAASDKKKAAVEKRPARLSSRPNSQIMARLERTNRLYLVDAADESKCCHGHRIRR